jgi:nitrate reductase assembly molybdenum cofactor insertion protein NarJ
VSLESVLQDLDGTKERVEQAHHANERAAEKARSELHSLADGLQKLKAEFDDTAERFEVRACVCGGGLETACMPYVTCVASPCRQFFQEMREYVSSLCGCLREKESMIGELVSAIGLIRREAAERRRERRAQDQVRCMLPFIWCWSLASRGLS